MEGLETIRELKAEFLDVKAGYRASYLALLNDDSVSDYDKMAAFIENPDLHNHSDWEVRIPGIEFDHLERYETVYHSWLIDKVIDIMTDSEHLINNDSGDMPWYLALKSGSPAYVALMYLVHNNLGSFDNDW